MVRAPSWSDWLMVVTRLRTWVVSIARAVTCWKASCSVLVRVAARSSIDKDPDTGMVPAMARSFLLTVFTTLGILFLLGDGSLNRVVQRLQLGIVRTGGDHRILQVGQ